MSRRPTRLAAVAVGAVTSIVALAAGALPASAHVTAVTYGTTFTAGATNVFYLRVPHGCPDEGAPASAMTSKLVVDIPAAATGVKPEKKAGWSVAVVKDGAGTVTQVTWTANTAADAVPDWTFADFGLRATLKGVGGEKISFPATQVCGYHDDGTVASGLQEEWRGADAPTVTLVDSAVAVSNATALADLKARVLGFEIYKAILEQLRAQGLTRWTGDVAVSFSSSGRLNITADLATIHRYQTVTIRAAGTPVASLALNSVGDVATTLTASQSRNVPRGSVVEVVLGDATMATTVAPA